MQRVKISRATRDAVLSRQDHKCASCCVGLDIFDIDHIVPYAVQPTNCAEALQALCPTCHARKSRRELKMVRTFTRMRDGVGTARICWACKKRVSKFFWNGFVCADCTQGTQEPRPVDQSELPLLQLLQDEFEITSAPTDWCFFRDIKASLDVQKYKFANDKALTAQLKMIGVEVGKLKRDPLQRGNKLGTRVGIRKRTDIAYM